MAWASGIVELFLCTVVIIVLKIYETIMNKAPEPQSAASAQSSEQKYKDDLHLEPAQPEAPSVVAAPAGVTTVQPPPTVPKVNPVPPAELRYEKGKLYSSFYLIFSHHIVAISLFSTQAGPSVLAWLHGIAFLAFVIGNYRSHDIVIKYSHIALYAIDFILIWWAIFYYM